MFADERKKDQDMKAHFEIQQVLFNYLRHNKTYKKRYGGTDKRGQI